MESQVPGRALGVLVELEAELDERLGAVDAALAAHYPGERAGRQPVHRVYVPADRFHARLVPEHGAAALQATEEHETLLLGLVDGDHDLFVRVREKLGREPVEDLRIDFEDGYGSRPDDEEDADARRSAAALLSAILLPCCAIAALCASIWLSILAMRSSIPERSGDASPSPRGADFTSLTADASLSP